MTSLKYLAYHFKVEPLQPGTEILIAQLSELGFESFVESADGLSAFIQSSDWYEAILDDVSILQSNDFDITSTFEEIEQVNWNQKWEENFDPILVDATCYVRAPFHQPVQVTYDIVIEPKMSFGTGHHETTYMMIQHILRNDFVNKAVLDMGCGTAVLAILSELKGSKPILAIDYDHWCFQNSLENVQRNGCKHISVLQGSAELLNNKSFDIILANINRNVLLDQIEIYASCLNPEGVLFLSGFYNSDVNLIEEKCNKHMLKLVDKLEENNWVSLKFIN